MYTMEYYSAISKDEILPFVTTWMGLEKEYHAKESKSVGKSYGWYDFPPMWDIKPKLMDTDRRVVTRGKGWEDSKGERGPTTW